MSVVIAASDGLKFDLGDEALDVFSTAKASPRCQQS
jgi:hypothetical protein